MCASQENYFFKLTAHEEAVQRFVASDAVQPARAANEVKAWVADGCRDFSITRAEVEWGIRVPRDTSQTIYVWFDALIGYLSALLPEGQEVSAAALQEHGWPAGVHIIGRDILRFHAVFWPGMLQSMGLPLPGKVFGHGFLTKDGLKMGKSLGNVLNPFQLVDAYGADAVRCAAASPARDWPGRSHSSSADVVHRLQIVLHEGDPVRPGRRFQRAALPGPRQCSARKQHREPSQPEPQPAEEEL